MKNLVKTGLLSLTIASLLSACGDGDKAAAKKPIDSPAVQIDTTKKDHVKTAIDTAKKDTSKKQWRG